MSPFAIAWLFMLYVAGNLALMRCMIHQVEPLPGPTAFFLLTLAPMLAVLLLIGITRELLGLEDPVP